MSAVTGLLSRLQKRRDEQKALCVLQLEQAQRSGRTHTTAAEEAALKTLAGLDEQIAHYRDEQDRMGDAASFSARLGTNTQPTRKKPIMDSNLTYRAHDRSSSWIRDLVRHQLGRTIRVSADSGWPSTPRTSAPRRSTATWTGSMGPVGTECPQAG